MSNIIQFIKEVKAEAKNITWPKRQAIIQLTIVVISISTLIALILGGFDYLFIRSIGLVGQLKTQPIQPQIIQPTPVATSAPSIVPTINIKKTK